MAARKASARPFSQAALDRRADIAERAASLFAERGYFVITMDDVAYEVGLAKPTLYHYYSGKEELLYSIHEQLFDFLRTRMVARVGKKLSASEELREIFIDIFELVAERRGHAQAFFEYSKHLSGEYKDRVQKQRDDYDSRVTSIIERGIAEGAFRAVDPRVASLGFFGMTNWAYQWFEPGGPRRPRDLANDFFDLLYGGLRPA